MPRRKRKISQTILARQLGVSQALVSLVLNGRREGVHVSTYERIWAHALERGYRPKGMHLPASPLGQVGIIFGSPLALTAPSHHFGHVQQGLHSALQKQSVSAVLLGTETQLNSARLRDFFPPGHTFRGVVLFGEVSRSLSERLRSLRLPVVGVSARYPGVCHSVVADEKHALESLVQHLRTLGHRRFGWIGGNSGQQRHDARLRAMESSLDGLDLDVSPRYRLQLPTADRAEGAEGVHTLKLHFGRRDFPTAFICYNTLMAAGAIRAFEREGLSVPRDLSVASAEFSLPTIPPELIITAAGSNPQAMGEAAARLINPEPAQRDPGAFTEQVIPAQVFIGETTGPAPRDVRVLRSRDIGWTKTIAA